MDLTKLFKTTPCDPAQEWTAFQPDQSPAALYAACPRGDWLLWALADLGLDTTAIGFWCAERARQSALRALDVANVTGPKVDRLRACAPVVDKETAMAAWQAGQAAWVAAWAAAAVRAAVRAAAWAAEAAWADAAYAAAGAAAWAAWEAVRAAADAAATPTPRPAWPTSRPADDAAARAEAAAWAADTAQETEHQAIADHVRKTFPWVVVEATIAARMA